MKFNRVIFNRIILGLIAFLQTIHLICQIRKDYFIGTENLSQLQIEQRIEMSSIQGPISYIIGILTILMIVMIVITWRKKDVSRLLKEDIILIISLFVISYIIMNIFYHFHKCPPKQKNSSNLSTTQQKMCYRTSLEE